MSKIKDLFHPVEAIKFTTQGDYACSWCEYLIPIKRNELQEWCSYDVAGMFCSERCAAAATNNLSYKERWAFND